MGLIFESCDNALNPNDFCLGVLIEEPHKLHDRSVFVVVFLNMTHLMILYDTMFLLASTHHIVTLDVLSFAN